MRWKRLGFAMVLSGVALAALVYAGDYAIFRLREGLKRNPYDSVTVQHFDAVQKKNGKTEFFFHPPQLQTCANALFPHDGLAPCWYLNRHREQGTNI